MAGEDILYGLKNAIARGENPSQAAQSFINAGYAEKDVNDALRQITSGISDSRFTPSLPQKKMAELPELPPIAKKAEAMPATQQIQPPQAQQIASRPIPAKELQPLPKVEVKKKIPLRNVSNKVLLVSIGVVGLLIVILTIYLVSLLMA